MKKTLLSLLMFVATTMWAIDRADLDAALVDLDRTLERQGSFLDARQKRIDSLGMILAANPNPDLMMEIACAYERFNNDSAMHYLNRGAAMAKGTARLPFLWKVASLMPLDGFFEQAINTFGKVDPDSVPPGELASYYDSGRQMYSYMSAFFRDYPEIADRQRAMALQFQAKLLEVLPRGCDAHRFNLGEYYFLVGEHAKAKVLLEEVLENEPANSNIAARTAHHLSQLARTAGDTIAATYYLTLSAMYDALSATREVESLQELGSEMYASGDIGRAYSYVSAALDNAVTCGAPLRMVEASKALPIIERSHSSRLTADRHILYWVLSGMALLLIILLITMLVLRREMHKMSTLQTHLRDANNAKDVYIGQFLQLCSIYMDKLNQFCKIATRKLAAGQADELYRMTKSGKFVEEQSREFYEVFDNAFLNLHPDFVAQVNKLLRPDAQIELKPGESLNTDLRILAFMRLGIEDSQQIAQVLNYSLNTIYAYRNRLKSRAINREDFENDVMRIGL